MLQSLDISASALAAQRVRLNAISSNIANLSTQRNEHGELAPYQARHVIFQVDESVGDGYRTAGVRVAAVETDTLEPRYKWEPHSPLAVQEGKWKGYVAYPNINLTEQFVDALEATRAYEANVGVLEISKAMGQQTLRILG